MEGYTFLRSLADSWALLALFCIFIGVVFYAWRPGSSTTQSDAANIVFRNESTPNDPEKGAK